MHCEVWSLLKKMVTQGQFAISARGESSGRSHSQVSFSNSSISLWKKKKTCLTYCDVPFCQEELKHLHKPNNTHDVLQWFQTILKGYTA